MTAIAFLPRRALSRPTVLGIAGLVVVAGATGSLVPHSDVALYQHYARSMWNGPLAAGLPKEYPALAGAFFLAVSGLPGPYAFAFGACMAAGLLLLISFGIRLVRDQEWTQRALLYLTLATATLMFTRFDLLPATCTFAAVAYARRGKWGSAWGAAAVGTALKLFPAVLLPGFFLFEWRTSGRPPWRRAVVTAIGFGTLGLFQTLIAPGTLLNPFTYEAKRGFEFSSLPATVGALIHPGHLKWAFAFGNWQLAMPFQGLLSAAFTMAEIAVIAAIWVAVARGALGLDVASLAVVSVAVLSDHALAPQYLIWLAPLWALWPVRRSWLLAALLTFLTYPTSFEITGYAHMSLLLPTVIAGIRNGVLLVGTISWFRDVTRGRHRVDGNGERMEAGLISRPSHIPLVEGTP